MTCSSIAQDQDGEIVAATLQAGNLVILVQPPRGFGENPIAIYHDPDLAPSHHYLAVYRWLEKEFGAHAVMHVGKHGNLEWLPGKNLGMSACCGTDAAIGSLPLIYPFLVNDPGRAPRPSGAPTPRSSTTSCRRWPGPRRTATSRAWNSCSTSTQGQRDGSGQGARAARGDLDPDQGRTA